MIESAFESNIINNVRNLVILIGSKFISDIVNGENNAQLIDKALLLHF